VEGLCIHNVTNNIHVKKTMAGPKVGARLPYVENNWIVFLFSQYIIIAGKIA
jgi:hypothetical protein